MGSVLLAMLVCTALGMVIEGLAYKPLRQAGSLAVLITAIGVSYFLQNAAQLLFGANPKNFTPVVSGQLQLLGGQLRISYLALLTVAACIVIMVGLTAFISKSKMGKAMRACSEDRGAAQLMGINVNATISMTFAIGSALAAVAGVLLCSYSPVLQPTTGSMPGIKAFTAAVFGGIGSIPGAFLGGHAAGDYRGHGPGLYLHPAVQRHPLRRADRRAAGEALGPAGQVCARESVRWPGCDS